jgi:predicted Zn-dependent peptidase
MDFNFFTLSNGIRVIHMDHPGNIAHCGLVVNAGSRDERSREHGLAHFIEHCIFKGTTHRKTFHILSRLDAVGAELNAYTTKEETWIYASFMKQYLERAVELIADITFNSTFPDKEIVKEKAVIIDEIASYLDSPSDMIFDEFEEMIFRGHSLGRSILGTEKTLKHFGKESILGFLQRQYSSSRMVFSVVANLPLAEVKSILEEHLCGNNYSGKAPARKPFTSYNPEHLLKLEETHQVHYLLGNLAYSHNDDRRIPMILLNNYLGGPAMNSRLNLNIREKYGIAYNIESHYHAYSDTGLFQVYLGTDGKTFEKARELIFKELRHLRENRLGVSQLKGAKQQLIGQIALAQESGSGIMQAIGKSYLLYDRVDTLEEVFAQIDKISSSEILDIANEIFDERTMSSLTYLSD